MALLSVFDIKIASGKVGSDLTNFVVRVDLSDMPAQFWADVDASGGYIRVLNSSGSVIPFDIVNIDTGTDTGILFFKSSLLSASDNHFRIIIDDSLSGLAVTDTNGRNNVWVDYHRIWHFDGGNTDRTGSGNELTLQGDAVITSGELTFDGTDDRAYGTTSQYVDWTMCVAGTPQSVTGIRTIMSYTDATDEGGVSNPGVRTALVQVNGSQWEFWNRSASPNALVVRPGATSAPPAIGTRVHIHGRHNRTSNIRHGFYNGVVSTSTATSGSINYPGGNGDQVNIGASSGGSGGTNPTEDWQGSVEFAYIRAEILSDDWIAAEYDSWSDTSNFYAISEVALINKLGAYSVLTPPTEGEVSKLTAYSVLTAPVLMSIDKLTSYSVLTPPTRAEVSKLTSYSVLSPNTSSWRNTYKFYTPVVN